MNGEINNTIARTSAKTGGRSNSYGEALVSKIREKYENQFSEIDRLHNKYVSTTNTRLRGSGSIRVMKCKVNIKT